MKTYTLKNSQGLNHGAWRSTFTSHAEAKQKLKELMGWTRISLSRSYASSEDTSSESAYGSVAEMRRDEDGQANAPTIVTHHR